MPGDPQLTVENVRRISDIYSEDAVSAIAGKFGTNSGCNVSFFEWG
jgi:hypothetical protein